MRFSRGPVCSGTAFTVEDGGTYKIHSVECTGLTRSCKRTYEPRLYCGCRERAVSGGGTAVVEYVMNGMLVASWSSRQVTPEPPPKNRVRCAITGRPPHCATTDPAFD